MFSALYLVWKPLVQQEGSFILPAGSPGSNLIFLQDSLSNVKFLVDSGASVSVFPHHSSKPSSSSVFSTNPVVPAVPPTHGRLRHHPVVRPSAPVRPAIPSATTVSPPADDLPALQRRHPRRLVRDYTSAPFSTRWCLGESCGAPVGFLECSTQHTSYFICYYLGYGILHLV